MLCIWQQTQTCLQVLYKGPPGHDAHDAFILLMDDGSKFEVPCHALQPRSKVHQNALLVEPPAHEVRRLLLCVLVVVICHSTRLLCIAL